MRRIRDETLKVPATGVIELGGLAGLCAPLSDGAWRAIDERRAPVNKLSWRLDLAKAAPGTFLDRLFSTDPSGEAGDLDTGTVQTCRT